MNKSMGVTATERMLAEYGERTFLKLWSYANPHKDDGHELCDLLVVFGDHVFIFFDRESVLPEALDKDPQVLWNRWKSNVIDRQINTARGAARYIRSKRRIFIDSKNLTPFPLLIDPDKAIIHKIVVAHGAKQACENSSSENIYGSLAVTYCEEDGGTTPPFHITISKSNPVHVFDSHNLPILLSELDTIADFSAYLDEKLKAVARFNRLMYAGEEDLLGHYFLNFDHTTRRHVIGLGVEENVVSVWISEGEWQSFIDTEIYKNTKKENQSSYFWDELIQRTCQNSLDGTSGGDSDILSGKSAIFEMVKEPRFSRRWLAGKMLSAVQGFPDSPDQFMRQVTFLPSFLPNVGYVLLQVKPPDAFRTAPDHREKRRALLEIACAAARNRFTNLTKVIGIGIDAPKFADGNGGEDFLLMNCESWTEEMSSQYELENAEWRFFKTPQMQQYNDHLSEFVLPHHKVIEPEKRSRVGRNEMCPCGSGEKFKKCHGR